MRSKAGLATIIQLCWPSGFDQDTLDRDQSTIHDRVGDRLQNTRFLTDPDAIVEGAETLLSSKTSTWVDLAVGRRFSELLGFKRMFEKSWQIKTHGTRPQLFGSWNGET
jgi:hypothetical protein